MMPESQRSRAESGVAAYFEALGRTVEAAWRKVDYDEARFADIACEALRAAPPAACLDAGEVIRWLASAAVIPYQLSTDEAFGQPPLTLFWNGQFQIEVLFWHTGTPAIHQHGFSGAFSVLGGSSVHCRYGFAPRRKVSARFLLGAVELREVELLAAGALRPIGRGGDLIHSLFHLESPSATVVVRTCEDAEAGPEYAYYPPAVAVDPGRSDVLRTKRLQILDMLAASRSADLESVAAMILAGADLHTAFLVLLRLGTHGDGDLYGRLLARARERHGEAVEDLAAAVEEERRRQRIVDLRHSVLDPDLRFFLALLLNVPGRAAIDRLIQARYPRGGLADGDPAALAERWIGELARSGALGIEIDAAIGRLLHGCLRGDDPDEIVRQLRAEHRPEAIDAQAAEIHEACRRIVGHPILSPLFR
ncbi:MAG TPA: hypothetical protein VGG20_15040 [Thermoanaerobaculia bacterium]|jgi:hypothetical protein